MRGGNGVSPTGPLPEANSTRDFARCDSGEPSSPPSVRSAEPCLHKKSRSAGEGWPSPAELSPRALFVGVGEPLGCAERVWGWDVVGRRGGVVGRRGGVVGRRGGVV